MRAIRSIAAIVLAPGRRSAVSSVDSLEARLRRARIVPVVRIGDPAEARELVERLLEAGLDTIELTTSIRGWEEVIAELRERRPEIALGVGTILAVDQAQTAVSLEPAFCVSPRRVPEARALLDIAGIPFIEGGLTPTEVLDVASRGIAKLFPAHVVGPEYLRSLRAVAPNARIMPTGGIPMTRVRDWLAAGAVAVGVGSDLTAPGDIAERVGEALEV
jgi:2-dehydro-3-deoxyphosphogluconate aldolase/(4S)-4-hydroxy-2-oxoglutarate aldolase